MKNFGFIAIFFVSIILLSFNQKEQYKTHKPCTFTVKLPSSFSMKAMEEENNIDYCDYVAKTNSGKQVAEFHSLVKGRFPKEDVKELYTEALKTTEIEITYKTQKDNWFVISGIAKSNKKIYYWKRSVGKYFISDLNIEYAKEDAKLIEPYLGKISSSFVSD